MKQQYDSHRFTAPTTGVYAACFSNEFSTFSHKLVYVDFQVGDEPPLLPGMGEHATVMTQVCILCKNVFMKGVMLRLVDILFVFQMESSMNEVHESLSKVIDFQTHHRLQEAQGRKRAEDLNERVLWWSLLETIVIATIAIGQVVILRNFFSEKKPSMMSYNKM